jgi:type I restriction enzyme, S subunit
VSSQLPPGWDVTEVGTLFSIHGGGTPNRGVPAYWGGSIPWLSSGDIKTDWISESSETITRRGLEESAARMCRRGSVLVVVRSGILRHTLPVALLKREAAINQDIKAFDSGDDGLNAWLALAWRACARELLASNREGTTVESVKLDTLKDFELPVPPAAEQMRIVSKLETLIAKAGASRQRLEKIPLLLKRFRQSVLAAACTGRLTEGWAGHGEFREHALGDVAERITKGSTPTSYGFKYQAKGITFVRVENLNNGYIDRQSISHFISDEANRSQSRSILEDGDLLFSIAGTIGQTALVRKEDLPANTNQAIAIIRGTKRSLLPGFLRLQLQSGVTREQARKQERGGGMHNISLDDVRKLIVCVPSMDEQWQIVKRVEALFSYADQLERRFDKARAQVERLTSSFLAKAFRGELVPQNPNDEPASVLLERIKAEHARSVAESPKAIRRVSKPAGRRVAS